MVIQMNTNHKMFSDPKSEVSFLRRLSRTDGPGNAVVTTHPHFRSSIFFVQCYFIFTIVQFVTNQHIYLYLPLHLPTALSSNEIISISSC